MRRQSDFDRRFKRAERQMEVFGVIFFIAFMLVVGGILATAVNAFQSGAWSFEGGVQVWTDPKTGCRYTNSEYGMQPLIGRDGRPDCGGAQ